MQRFVPAVGRLLLAVLGCAVAAGLAGGRSRDEPRGRVRAGLLALYDFESIASGAVEDRAGRGKDSRLRIADAAAVRVLPGALELLPGGGLRSRSRPAKISDMVRIGREITIEAWIRPAGARQRGPATILSMSDGSSERNFLLGQDGDRFVARFRTTKTGRAGEPGLASASGASRPEATHVVFTKDRTGRAKLYVDGGIAAEGEIPGGVEDWEKAPLTLGYEPSVGRPWVGTYYLVAIYGRELATHEVERNYRAGFGAASMSGPDQSAGKELFETRVAPLLARRCIGCHDAASKQGGLDLSRRSAALAGGANGNAINPGSADTSLLWLLAEGESMPKGLPPLSEDEKQLLRDWIQTGAPWTFETIDPAIHAHGDRAMGNWVRRLTATEYVETVRGALGIDLSSEAEEILPPDVRADGFKNTAYNLSVDLSHVEAYARLAKTAVDRFDADRLLEGQGPGEAWISDVGERLLRGVMTEHEVALYAELARAIVSTGGSQRKAAASVLEAMLQSPRFLYRVELQRGDGTRWPADPLEVASRLSYIVWGGPPDKLLREKARAGALADEGALAAEVDRLLADPRAVTRSRQFVAQWLNLDRLFTLQPNPGRFPSWDPSLGGDMRSETLAFFQELAWRQKRPMADLLNAQFSYLTPRLAAHYGLPSGSPGLRRYDLASVPSRGGLLTQGSVLTVGGDDASMVTRGLFVLRDLLYSDVGDPPPGLDTRPVPSSPGRSHRAIATERVESGACGGCHGRFEPLAYGLEKFDGLGSYHEVDEHGNTLREDGEILFPGESEPVSYGSSAEMMNLLAGSERVRRNLIRKLTQFAIGRPLVASDQPAVESIFRAAQRDGGTYQSSIKAIALSDLVRTTATEL